MSQVSNTSSSNWVPSVDQTPEIIGTCILFVPYVIILLPFFHNRIVFTLRNLYYHQTPRNEWNNAVDQSQPRRLIGYILSSIFLYTPCLLIFSVNNNIGNNSYPINVFQYFIYISIPLIISIIRPPSHSPCDIFDLLIILSIIIPIEFSEQYSSFLPDIKFKIYKEWDNTPNISLLNLTAFNCSLFIYFIFRPLTNTGLNPYNNNMHKLIQIKWCIIRFIFILILFLILFIPFCLIIDYLSSAQPIDNNTLRDGIFRYFTYYFLIGLPLEFIYRGIIQNEIHQKLEYRQQALSYLRGGRLDSLTENLNQFNDDDADGTPDAININVDFSASPPDHDHPKSIVVSSDKSINSAKIISNDVDIKGLPYYSDIHDDDDRSQATFIKNKSLRYIANPRNTFSCDYGYFYFIRLDNLRDWFVILLSSILYAITVVNYRNANNVNDTIYAIIILLWLGFCCGLLYKHTKSCFISAILQSLIIFNLRYVFNQDCNAAC